MYASGVKENNNSDSTIHGRSHSMPIRTHSLAYKRAHTHAHSCRQTDRRIAWSLAHMHTNTNGPMGTASSRTRTRKEQQRSASWVCKPFSLILVVCAVACVYTFVPCGAYSASICDRFGEILVGIESERKKTRNIPLQLRSVHEQTGVLAWWTTVKKNTQTDQREKEKKNEEN